MEIRDSKITKDECHVNLLHDQLKEDGLDGGLSLLYQGSLFLVQNTAITPSVNALYQKAFLSVSKATFLLTQWKACWDESIAANIVQTTAAEAATASANFDSRVLDEAVASATATMHAEGFPDQLGFPGHARGPPALGGPLPAGSMQNNIDRHVEI